MSNDPEEIEEPNPEVLPKAVRRRFTASYKRQVLEHLDELKGSGEIGAYLREEGLYSSQISKWRRALEQQGAQGLEPKRRGPAPKSEEQRQADDEHLRLQRENELLRKKLAQAEAIIDIQKKVSNLLGLTPSSEE